jgi:Fe-S cluster assembly ATP-binding protein
MLELQNVSCIVDDENSEKEILKNVSFKAEDGFVAITGPNGGGKSTLAKIIAGIMKPTSGKILLDGTDITDMSITERANLGVSYAFQQPVRFKGLTVKDLIKLASKENTPDICGILSEVGLCAKDYINREVNASLSGGELKRIEIATVFAKASKISIFDEPEAGIDLWSFQNLIQVFREMRRSIHGTILIISHQERILEIADEIVVLKDGAIVKHGPKVAVLPTLIGTEFAVGSCPQNGPGCFEGLSISRLAVPGGPGSVPAAAPGSVPAASSDKKAEAAV